MPVRSGSHKSTDIRGHLEILVDRAILKLYLQDIIFLIVTSSSVQKVSRRINDVACDQATPVRCPPSYLESTLCAKA